MRKIMKKIKDILPTEDTLRLVTPPSSPPPPKIEGSKYAFYGSLRKGQYNHSRAGLAKQIYIKTVKIPGFIMYSLGAFPMIVRGTSADEITVDLFALISPDLERGIHLMEIGAGYERITVKIEGEDYYIYIYDRAPSGITKVKSGDWAVHQVEVKKNGNYWA